ncbi:hypothetical protein ABT56_19695 [Photobacterium aquae]|uniref:Regulatory protein n=1 Tax=Photobacterium aquae TaxID=1195763 RepID=A0A0J1GUF1_9GAMM|nr:DUF1176 domain-containing protein [Photobacterium aquae]KLV03350.1 hypothetical protein ABT56_19695 [Photobacterium aquae]
MKLLHSATLALCIGASSAAAFDGENFYHKDWVLTCDNTGTCRAAGYAEEESENPIAVMFTRNAGAATPVTAKFYIGAYSESEPKQINLYIDGTEMGPIDMKHEGKLSEMQVHALLSVVTKDAVIEFGDAKTRWELSGSGASAIFRKMDEYQGRQSTPFAIVTKGYRPESQVLPAEPAPVVVNRAMKGELKSIEVGSPLYTKMLPLLRAGFDNDEGDFECPSLFEESPEISMVQITPEQKIYAASCWMAAYNWAMAYWLVNDNTPDKPLLLPVDGNEYIDGTITATHKGRGIGDCWSANSWVFDGKQMVHTKDMHTGICRLIVGGVDPMPTKVSTVISPAEAEN